jgi:hypothetical protein
MNLANEVTKIDSHLSLYLDFTLSKDKIMGHSIGCICNQCGRRWEDQVGGGMSYMLLRCEKCGATSSLSFDRFEKMPIFNFNDETTPKKNGKNPYNCKCGGNKTEEAPLRCPKCKSLDYREDESFEKCCSD